MNKTFYSFLLVAMFSFSALFAKGAEITAQAIVLKVNGTVHANIGGKMTVVKVGDKLPEGATIITSPASTVEVQTFTGAVASIEANTTVVLEKLSVTTSGGAVTKQTALLNLKVGSILSTIDPANHNINDYGIRTPKGVAAARGTVYKVTVSATGKVQVFVTSSTVEFINPTTGQKVRVEAGFMVTVDENGNISQPVRGHNGGEGVTEVGKNNNDGVILDTSPHR